MDRKMLLNALVFWVVLTAGYAAFRLIKQDEWRWDHLLQSYLGAFIGFFVVWLVNRSNRGDANG